MVEGYDAADPERASTLALRDEWMGRGRGTQDRIAGGYGALIDFLLAECRSHGAEIHLGAVVTAIDVAAGRRDRSAAPTAMRMRAMSSSSRCRFLF